MSVVELVASLEALDISVLQRDDVNAGLSSVARVRSWADAKQAQLIRRLKEIAELSPTVLPEADIATASRGDRREAAQAVKRSETLDAIPDFESALAGGALSSAHVDALTRALDKLESEQRAILAADGERLAAIAARSTPAQFTNLLRHEIIRIDARAGESKLERQRRNTHLRWWLDPQTGMWCVRGEFDPETGLGLQGRIENMVETSFHAGVPSTCPTGPSRQDHLCALALVCLTQGHSSTHEGRNIDDADRRVEISILIDLDTMLRGLHEHSLIDNGSGADLPVESYRRLACHAAIIPIVLNSAGVVLDQGREIRLANRNQRRALRAMYDTCAAPGCTVRSRHCEPHHIAWWRHGGSTDLHNLVPLCSRHHHCVHEGGWKLTMAPDRSLTITYPDGAVQTTGPPGAERAA